MIENTASIVSAVVVVVVWMAWVFLSETRHNHGFWVAFLMPLAPFIILVLWVIYVFIKYSSYFIFKAISRPEDHEEFMRRLKIRSGVFLLF